LQSNARDLINLESKELKYKFAGLILLDCLLDVNYNDEIYMERRGEMAKLLLVMLKNIKCTVDLGEKVLKLATQCVGHLAKVASPYELESLSQTFVAFAQEFTKDSRSDTNRLIGTLLLNQFAINSPHFIFGKRYIILAEIWTLICDKSAVIRESAAEALDSTLLVIAQRDLLPETLRQALKQIEAGLSTDKSLEAVIGSVMILEVITRGSSVTTSEMDDAVKNYHFMDHGMHADDLIWAVLSRKDYGGLDIGRRVIKLIPRLAVTFDVCFSGPNNYTEPNSYLQFTIKFLLDTIRQKRDRSIAYISLGKLFVAMPSKVKSPTLNDEIFASINDGFKDPFCTAALDCLRMYTY
jgi:hypothetical protein